MKWLLISVLLSISAACVGQLPAIELLGKKEEVRLPFDYYYNFILIHARMEGFIPMTFIFDTGAENCILFNKSQTDLLRMPYDKEILLRGSDQTVDLVGLICRGINFRFPTGDWVSTDAIVLKEDLYDMFAITGKKIDGIIGSNFFKGLVVEVNYRKNYISFHRPEAFNAPRGYSSVPMIIHQEKPHVVSNTELSPTNSKDLIYLFDTGAGIPLLLHNNTDDAIQIPESAIGGYLGSGLGGHLKGYLSRVNYFDIGPHRIPNLIVGFQALDSIRLADSTFIRNGLIGNPILKRFDPIFDYSRQQIWLRPNKFFDDPLEVDRSGIIAYAGGNQHNQIYIKEIIPGSPAEEAGLLPGDRILSLNGWGMFWYDLAGLVKKWQGKAGKTIRMKIKRGEEKKKVVFTLRDIL